MAKKANSRSRSSSAPPSSPVPDWQHTYLWKTLEQRARKPGSIHAKAMLHTVETWMGQLDTVLRSGGTSPEDFTLHNDQHAFRVAKRMAKLFTPAVQRNISDYELALLLLAAYGHDVGMTPQRQQVARHHRHLFHPQDSQLSAAEQQQFQEFIDNYPARAVTLPLTSSIDDLNLADELTTYYVRDRHNQWSGDWLRDNLHDNLAHLQDTVPVLIRLCQSHHQGFDRLALAEFDPILSTGPHPQLIHLRYLACLLRLADILENDPERTPEVIFRHRSIQDRPKSLTHWIKDHHFTIDEQQNQLVIVATPPDARTHHAIEQLADWIDHELRGIAAFGEKLPVEYKVGRDTIRREWHLAPALIRRIQPQPGTYRYIDGAFRPNTQRLLQLLSNEQLYGKPIVAVRELLQNAFDAVREKIARRRLDLPTHDKADRKWEKALGDQEKVTLTLRRVTQIIDGQEQVHHHLICDDTGVGLTDKLITGHLLVSGQSRRHDILDLERRCQEAGFPLGRTGQFGIGVLSYFMLAKEVRLTTTRYQGCGDSEGQSWHFHTHGLSDFGELRPAPTTEHPTGGTRVEWHLRPDRIKDETKFAAKLREYVLETLIRIPCQFEFKVEGFPQAIEGWQRPTGWTMTLEEWKVEGMSEWLWVLSSLDQKESFLSQAEAIQQRDARVFRASAQAQAAACLRLAETEVPLPDGLGWSRLILPYFDLPKGRSLFFPFVDQAGRRQDELYWGIHTSHSTRDAWKGMACHIEKSTFRDEEDQRGEPARLQLSGFTVETDIQQVDRQTLNASRSSLVLSWDVASAACDALASAAHVFADAVLEAGPPSFYSEVNLAIQDRPLTLRPGAAWFVGDSGWSLQPLAYPLTTNDDRNPSSRLIRASNGEVFQQLAPVICGLNGRIWYADFPSPDCLCFRSHTHQPMCRCGFLGCWERPPLSRAALAHARFPEEWGSLVLVYHGSTCLVWQAEHPLLRLLSTEQRADIISRGIPRFSEKWEDMHTFSSPGEIAAQLLAIAVGAISTGLTSLWSQFSANHPDLVSRMWQTMSSATGLPLDALAFFVTSDYRTVRLAPEGVILWEWESSEPSPLPKVTDPDFLLVEA